MTIISPSLGGQVLTSPSQGTSFTSTVDATFRQITDGTYPFLVSAPTTDGVLKGRVYLNNMAAADTTTISVETEVSSGVWEVVLYTFTDAQTNQQYIDISVRYYNGLGARVRLRQAAGTARAYTYRYLTGQEE